MLVSGEIVRSLVTEAQKVLLGIKDPEHNIGHTEDVMDNLRWLSEALDGKLYFDKDLAELCGWWHDVGRIDGAKDHESISADMLEQALKSKDLDTSFVSMCRDCIKDHKWNAMTPISTEGKLLKDADKIAFLGIRRWKSCIESGYKLDDMLSILPAVRNQILYYQVSRELFDIRVVELITYLGNIYLKENIGM